MSWKSPLIGYENAEPLPDTFNADGKSLFNPPGPKSSVYEKFPEPFDPSNNGFDFHSLYLFYFLSSPTHIMFVVYHMQNDAEQAKFAKELHERIRREFPEVCTI